MTLPGIVSTLVFLGSLYLIFSEKLNRTITATASAVVMVVLGLILGFYNEEQAVQAIDLHTLGLLLGMMILVALLQPTGFFQYLAVWAGRVSRGRPVRLFVLLGVITTILSMFLDNVTTVVLIAPVTVLISEILGISAVPLLIAEALLSNTGGVATLVGDPPNVIIGSAAGFSFTDFLIHALPVVLVVWVAALIVLLYLFRFQLYRIPVSAEAVLKLNPDEALNDWETARRVLIVLAFAILFFFLESSLHISPAFVALSAAAAALVWVRPENIPKTLEQVEWSVLIFFSGLFVMVGGLEAAGVLDSLAGLIAQARGMPPVLFGVIMIWVVAALSAVVDNIPITIALIPVIHQLGQEGIDIYPLWWALAFGAGLGGNGTIIGSTANFVVASISERTRTPITPALWHKRGLPVMLVTCAVASVLYVLLYPILFRG